MLSEVIGDGGMTDGHVVSLWQGGLTHTYRERHEEEKSRRWNTQEAQLVRRRSGFCAVKRGVTPAAAGRRKRKSVARRAGALESIGLWIRDLDETISAETVPRWPYDPDNIQYTSEVNFYFLQYGLIFFSPPPPSPCFLRSRSSLISSL